MSEATVDTFRTAAHAVSAELRNAGPDRQARLAVIAWCLRWESDTGHHLDDDEAASIVRLAEHDVSVRRRLRRGELEVSDLCWAALRAREAAALVPPASPADRLVAAVADVLAGDSVAEAAATHGCLRGAVVLRLREAGRRVPRKVDTMADRVEAAAAEARALGLRAAALRYGRDARRVAKRLLCG